MLLAKFIDRLGLDRFGQLAGEIDRGGANHLPPPVAIAPRRRNAVGQMGLSGPAGAVEHQRIVTIVPLLDDRSDGGLDQPILGPGQEIARGDPAVLLGGVRYRSPRKRYVDNAVNHVGSAWIMETDIVAIFGEVYEVG